MQNWRERDEGAFPYITPRVVYLLAETAEFSASVGAADKRILLLLWHVPFDQSLPIVLIESGEKRPRTAAMACFRLNYVSLSAALSGVLRVEIPAVFCFVFRVLGAIECRLRDDSFYLGPLNVLCGGRPLFRRELWSILSWRTPL